MSTSRITKYSSVFNIGLQNTFAYRWNYFLRALFGLIPLAGTVFLWAAMFKERGGGLHGYDYGSMIYYYLLMILVSQPGHANRGRMADRLGHSRGPDQFLPDQADELSRVSLQHFPERPSRLPLRHDFANRAHLHLFPRVHHAAKEPLVYVLAAISTVMAAFIQFFITY